MAVVVTATTIGRDLDEINLNISGTLNTTVASTDLNVITPDGSSIDIDMAPENFTIPTTLPIDRIITPSILGLSAFEDGVYSFVYTVNYTDLSQEIAEASILLFSNNTKAAWFDLMEKHISLNCICSDDPEARKRNEGRELIQGAEEAFELSRYDDAKRLLDGALEIINSCK